VRIDLHIHSTASDGALSPGAVVRAAKAGGLDLIALTDHDTTAGVGEAIAAAAEGPLVIPAIEISSSHEGRELHFLGYHIDPSHPALRDFASAARTRREERMRTMIERLARLGAPVSLEQVRRVAGTGPLGRPHLARALVEAGHVRTTAEAFTRFLADHGPVAVPTDLLTPREAIELVHAAGGTPVWAHPPIDVLDRELQRFQRWGLEGIECYRPQNTPDITAALESAARRFGLLRSGGSDWHGEWNGRLGDFAVESDRVPTLLDRGARPGG